MQVSVILPLYDRRDAIGRALGSVAAQQLQPLEVLVVDDGSRDDGAAVAESWADRLPGLRVLRQDNAGPGAARNRAIGEARGEWLAFLDSDDVWLPGKLAAVADAVTRDAEVELVHSERSYHFPDGSLRPDGGWPAARMSERDWLCGTFALKTSTVAVRRSLLEATGMLFAEDRRTCEDYHLFWPAIMAARRIGFLPEPLTEIHETDGSLTRTDNYTELLSDNIRIQTRVLRWAAARAIDAAPRAALADLQYRCAQDLLLARRARRQHGRLPGDLRLIAAQLPARRALRALVSAASGRPLAKHGHAASAA